MRAAIRCMKMAGGEGDGSRSNPVRGSIASTNGEREFDLHNTYQSQRVSTTHLPIGYFDVIRDCQGHVLFLCCRERLLSSEHLHHF